MNKHFSLSMTFLMMVGLYHAQNFLTPFEFKAPFEWKTSRLTLANEKGLKLSLDIREALPPPEYQFMDSSSRRLSELGSVVKFVAGQRRFDMVFGKSQPYQQMFLREEIPAQFASFQSRMKEGYLKQLAPFRAELSRRGIYLAVVPIPTKLSLYRKEGPENLGQRFATEPWQERGPECGNCAYRELASQAQDIIVDLQSTFAKSPSTSADPLFVPYDHQWTTRAAAVAGIAIVEKLRAQGLVVSTPALLHEGSFAPNHSKGMIRGLNLPSYFLHTAPFQFHEMKYRLKPSSASVTGSPRLYMAGTCYSNRMKHTEYGLGKQIANALGIELHDFSDEGTHGVAALKVLRKSGLKLRRGDILILEIAFRQPWDPEEVLELPHFEETGVPLS